MGGQRHAECPARSWLVRRSTRPVLRDQPMPRPWISRVATVGSPVWFGLKVVEQLDMADLERQQRRGCVVL